MLENIKNKLNFKKAILVTVANSNQKNETILEYLEELSELCNTLDIKPIETIIQKLDHPNVRTYVGKGKVEEIKTLTEIHDAGLVIFDDDLSASQVRNLEKILEKKVLDRSLLILDIFAMRAKTAQAKTQVELAQYQYLLPRLTRMWTHLSKQKGGNPGSRGPGEKELETDKRIVQDKISLLKKKLASIEKQGEIERKQRGKLVRVALVGYTNTGKSTLMQLLSRQSSDPENKLFATITSTVRKIVINNIPFLLTDTVGFIRKLPHTLIECFKSTLEEVKEADLLVHVIDFSNSAFEDHIKVVNQTLKEIGVKNIPIIMAFNKIDKLSLEPNYKEELKELEKKYSKYYNNSAIFISAKEKYNIDHLKSLIFQKVKKKHLKIYPNFIK
ncbi:MAG: GTPase HflX [Bacteroidetes bacterium]|nr:GTPase HflX [Bacteroidota bacterium]